jgi:hypothetical protein
VFYSYTSKSELESRHTCDVSLKSEKFLLSVNVNGVLYINGVFLPLTQEHKFLLLFIFFVSFSYLFYFLFNMST